MKAQRILKQHHFEVTCWWPKVTIFVNQSNQWHMSPWSVSGKERIRMCHDICRKLWIKGPPHPSSSNSLLICFMLQHSFYMQCNWNNAWICPSVWFATWYGKLCSPNWFFAIKLKLLRNVKTNMYMYTNTPTKLRELVVFNQLSPNLGN